MHWTERGGAEGFTAPLLDPRGRAGVPYLWVLGTEWMAELPSVPSVGVEEGFTARLCWIRPLCTLSMRPTCTLTNPAAINKGAHALVGLGAPYLVQCSWEPCMHASFREVEGLSELSSTLASH